MPLIQSRLLKSKPVVLISLDGFRWDYIEKHQAKNLAKIAKAGVRAERMIPVYPTKTFPNHIFDYHRVYSLQIMALLIIVFAIKTAMSVTAWAKGVKTVLG